MNSLPLLSLNTKSYTLFDSNSIKYGQVQGDVSLQLLGNLLGLQYSTRSSFCVRLGTGGGIAEMPFTLAVTANVPLARDIERY